MNDLPASFPDFPVFEPGEVWLVGAGPGDPRLLTLMALDALRQADVILHDALIDQRILSLAKPDATIFGTGKRGGRPSPQQTEINQQMISHARARKRVLRLKGGDPFVFGRGGEEAHALVAAGIPFRIVPGLTAGLSAAALAGIPATTRETNHAVILATGFRATSEEEAEDWEAIAKTGQPVILYMGMSHLGKIAAAFLRAGADPDLPVSVISSATFPEERLLDTRLARAETDAKEAGLSAPAVLIIGKIAALGPELRGAMVERIS